MEFDLGQTIRALREGHKPRRMTREQLAELVGVVASTVYRWENNEVSPGEDKRQSLAKIFEVSIGVLYGLEPLDEIETNDRANPANSSKIEALEERILQLEAKQPGAVTDKHLPYQPSETDLQVGTKQLRDKIKWALDNPGSPTAAAALYLLTDDKEYLKKLTDPAARKLLENLKKTFT